MNSENNNLTEMENLDPSSVNRGNDQIASIDPNARSISSPTGMSPLTPTPSTFGFSAPTPTSLTRHSMLGSDHSTRTKNHPVPPSPSRNRLDSEYSSRLQQQHQHQHSLAMSPPGIKRGRNRNFSFLAPYGGSIEESSEESKFTNIRSAFFTPDRSSSSTSSKPSRLNSFSPNTEESHSPYETPSRISRSKLATVSIDTSDTGYSDRFIPSRATSNLSFSFSDRDSMERSLNQSGNNSYNSNIDNDTNIATGTGADDPDGSTQTNTQSRGTEGNNSQTLLNALLRSELLGASPDYRPSSIFTGSSTPQRENNFLRFQSPRQIYSQDVLRDSSASVVNSFNLMPVASASAQRLLAAPQKRKRKIAKVPFKVLDAPSLQDDFYLNLVDWYVNFTFSF